MYLGIDTSCYTTSVAVVNDGEIIADERILLDVKQGERGLRQSDAVFMHIKNLPELMERLGETAKSVKKVAVSVAPRREENSYMPVFVAGTSFARTVAAVLNVPLVRTTHQEGHIAAAVKSCGFDDGGKFISVHLSGGTSEILLCEKDGRGYDVKIIGKSLDIPAGQLVDRTGVAGGLKFPCGKEMQELAEISDIRLPVTVKGTDFHLSGAEAAAGRMIEGGEKAEKVYYAVFICIAKTLEKALKTAVKEYGAEKILLCGGVGANTYVREYLEKSLEGIYFAKPEYSSDNAVGTAHICESW